MIISFSPHLLSVTGFFQGHIKLGCGFCQQKIASKMFFRLPTTGKPDPLSGALALVATEARP
jgi:hypothetical protein